MRASRRVDDGSFRERVEDLVPLLGADPSRTSRGFEKTPTAVTGSRGSVVYEINEYLFERSRH